MIASATAVVAAKREPTPHARLHAGAVQHAHRLKADVVGVLERGDRAAAVEGDVEFARQAIKRAIVENVMMPFAGERTRVEQLLRVNARRRGPSDVADIVGAGAFWREADARQPLDEIGRAGGLDLADLQIGARRHMAESAAEFFREVGDAQHLPRGQNAIGNA